jgi:succinoglycan biosynthesis protein ExoL
MTRVVVFGFDAREASQIRSIRAMQDAGADVSSFTFRRGNMNAGFEPDWPDVSLGVIQNGALLRRIPKLIGALVPVWRSRQVVRQADVIVARNFDMLLVALAARAVCFARAPVIYQCLDIHSIFTAPGPRGVLFRLAERLALRGVARLVVSSPAFLREYFEPLQKFRGDAVVTENRIVWTGPQPARPVPLRRQPGPVRLGWIGTLRCARSLDLLERTAQLLGREVEIVMRGVVHDHALPRFHNVLVRNPNIRFEGGYAYPDGLRQAYSGLDLVWAQDLWQAGANSDWLLPNRIYEAGYFGCPSIAVAGTETARKITRERLGFVIDEPDAEHLVKFLRGLDMAHLQHMKFDILRKPASLFSQDTEEVSAMLNLAPSHPASVRAHA